MQCAPSKAALIFSHGADGTLDIADTFITATVEGDACAKR